jgi:hypothetical protein
MIKKEGKRRRRLREELRNKGLKEERKTKQRQIKNKIKNKTNKRERNTAKDVFEQRRTVHKLQY